MYQMGPPFPKSSVDSTVSLPRPGLYTHISINLGVFRENTALLWWTLSENPELRAYCRTLRITLPPPVPVLPDMDGLVPDAVQPEEYIVETDFVGWLTNVKDLSVAGPFHFTETEKATWDLVRVTGQNMPKLEKLALGEDVGLEMLCDVLGEMKRLRTLEIGIGSVKKPTISRPGYGDAMQRPTAEQVGSSTITSLTIGCLFGTHRDLAQLLLLPARLEHFTFKGIIPRCHYTWWLSDLISALEPHKNTLRTLHFASARASGNDNFVTNSDLEDEVKDIDFSGFTKLEGITFIAAPDRRPEMASILSV